MGIAKESHDRSTPLLPDAIVSKEAVVLELEAGTFGKAKGHENDENIQTRAASRVYTVENVALLASYFCAGFSVQILSVPVAFYLIDTLGASSSVYVIYACLINMASNFKVFYGILSDCVPIFGYRRKPYLIIGWFTHIICYSILAMTEQPGVRAVILLSFMAAAGHMMGDIMTDAIVIGRTKRETGRNRGNIQASGYIFGAFGKVVGAVCGTLLSNSSTWGWGLSVSAFFWVSAAAPLVTVLPFVPHLAEVAAPNKTPSEALHENCREIWTLVQNRAVYRPVFVIYCFALFGVPNSAWTNFLLDGLGFDTFQLGLITVSGAASYWVGLVLYKTYMRSTDWRLLWLGSSTTSLAFSLAAAALVFGWNTAIGIPNLAFAMMEGVGIYACSAMVTLPACVMYALMTPPGSEGTSYAMLTTMATAASALASAIGDLMTGIFNVEDSTLKAGDFSGVWKLNTLTAFIGILPVLLIFLLPSSKEAQQEQQKHSVKSARAGIIFLVVAAGSIGFSLGEYIWKIWTE